MFGIPADIQYCLDSMMELHEISGDIYCYLNEFKPDIVSWWDNLEKTQRPGYNTGDFYEAQARTDYLNWRETASPVEKAYTTLSGASCLKFQAHDLALAIADDVLRHTGGRIPVKREIRQFLYEGYTQQGFQKNFNFVLNNAREDLVVVDRIEFNRYADERARQRQEAHELRMDAIRSHIDIEERGITKKAYNRELEKVKKQKRKAMVKSVDLLTSIAGTETTKIFLGREHVDIEGKNFNFKVQRNGNMTSLGHSALNIYVHSKSNEKLGRLCFYYEGTPVADQLVALMLDIQSGNEDIIMKTGNLFEVTPAASTYQPLLDAQGEKFLKKLNLGDHIGLFRPEPHRVNFDVTLPWVKKVIYESMKQKFQIFSDFDNRLLLTHTA